MLLPLLLLFAWKMWRIHLFCSSCFMHLFSQYYINFLFFSLLLLLLCVLIFASFLDMTLIFRCGLTPTYEPQSQRCSLHFGITNSSEGKNYVFLIVDTQHTTFQIRFGQNIRDLFVCLPSLGFSTCPD